MRRLCYVFRRKWFPGGPVARYRAFWHHVVRRYDSEVCGHCGRPVGLVWWCPDDALWLKVNGDENGIMCVLCFDRKAMAAGTFIRFEVKPL